MDHEKKASQPKVSYVISSGIEFQEAIFFCSDFPGWIGENQRWKI